MLYKLVSILITMFFLAIIVNSAHAQKLSRRATWQAEISGPSKMQPGAKIISIEPSSPLNEAGLKPNDIILKVDSVLVKDDETWTEISYGIRASQPVKIEVLRAQKAIDFNVLLNPIPIERHNNIDTFYEEVTNSYGITQRVIITKPKKEGKQPAIILIGGLSCSSIEINPNRKSNWTRVINDLVETSNMVVMRIEKPGVGDSGGDCSKSDFLTDISGFKAAVQLLKTLPYVDDSKIVVYGASMGSAIAPLLANEFDLAGIISDGTFFKTWFEHMLEIERRIRQMRGDSESEIVEKMNNYYIPLYYGMLIQKKTYQEVVDVYPALKRYNYHSAQHMYGRPVAYYHQLQEFDLAGEWEKVKVPVRIMRGTNDWIMSSYDNKMIIDVLKRNNHTDHILYEYSGLDHWNTIHESAKNSFEGKPGKWEDNISMQIIKWAQEIVGLY
ncbi:PDZ domain-containing protein [uncultured Psychroserpens sp.]|uniref:PDZ domain-containing protein n=1 Tax=uncultured Psychroserpens sp. TaxID=255436 RepID=UPI00261AEC70|nr:PDZ domain-containing protein [uncultured Psychroserpens sp.]